MQISYTLADIQKAADQFWQYAHQFRVIAFNGGLGAGKTTFTRALCAHIGVADVVSSPTFSLINEYHFRDSGGQAHILYHSDWYRLRDEEEAIQAGVEDMLARHDAWCIVEWAERVPGLLPPRHLEVQFLPGDQEQRVLLLLPHEQA